MDWFDPAYKAGGPVVSIIKLIENLHDQFDFYVLAGATDYGDTEEISGLVTDEWIDWRGIAKVQYVSNSNRTRARIFHVLDTTPADVYYIQGVFSLYFSIFPLIWWHQAKEQVAIIATRGMFHTSALKVKRFKKLLFLYAAKIMGWYHHVSFHSTNPEETEQLEKILGREATYIEASNFPRILEFDKTKKRIPGKLRLLNVARISPEKNSLFMLEALQQVIGEVELTVIGNYADPVYFRQFQKAMTTLPPNVKVNYLGHKPIGELPQYFRENDVFIMPTTGENFGHSIIEALSAGLPCLISEKTPWNGLEESNAGFNLPDKGAMYSKRIDAFIKMTDEEFSEYSAAARLYAEDKVNVEKTKESYIKLFS